MTAPEVAALPTWEECAEAAHTGIPTALQLFIYCHARKGDWRPMLSAALAEIRAAERERCAAYVKSECVQISGDGHLYRLSGAELAAGIIALPEPPRSPDQTAEDK